MSTEYIERGALINEIEKHFETIGANAQRLVARFPAADVEPVVHGEWMRVSDDSQCGRMVWVCSVCGYDCTDDQYIKPDRCHMCHAHMDERSDEK